METTQRTVVYTDAGRQRRQQMLHAFERRIDEAIIERKFVPGIEVVEVTGSDIDALDRSMFILFADRYVERLRFRRLILNTYLLLGSLAALVGLFYDRTMELLRRPIQLTFILVGVGLIVAALFFRSYLDVSTREAQRQRDYLRAIEEKERRSDPAP